MLVEKKKIVCIAVPAQPRSLEMRGRFYEKVSHGNQSNTFLVGCIPFGGGVIGDEPLHRYCMLPITVARYNIDGLSRQAGRTARLMQWFLLLDIHATLYWVPGYDLTSNSGERGWNGDMLVVDGDCSIACFVRGVSSRLLLTPPIPMPMEEHRMGLATR